MLLRNNSKEVLIVTLVIFKLVIDYYYLYYGCFVQYRNALDIF